MFTPITEFDGCRNALGQMARVEDTRAAAKTFRESFVAGPKVKFFQSFDLVRVPYPTRYGFRNAFSRERWVEFMMITNRIFVVQFDSPDGLKTMLVSPSDHERNGETPFFRRIQDETPQFVQNRIITRYTSAPEVVASLGLKPEDIDYITYDHLHTQDVRRWLGTENEPAIFPNAKLIVHHREVENARDLNPYQQDWYCPNGTVGVSEDKILRFEGSISLGDGVALIHTPGHTEGNHSIVINTDEGPWVISENGISVDSYAPKLSTAAGVAKYAETINTEVIINANTLENSIDQYISMVQEATIAGPSQRDGRYPNMFPSSEMNKFWLFPGTKPSFVVGAAKHGEITL
jgi:hypothetical protein